MVSKWLRRKKRGSGRERRWDSSSAVVKAGLERGDLRREKVKRRTGWKKMLIKMMVSKTAPAQLETMAPIWLCVNAMISDWRLKAGLRLCIWRLKGHWKAEMEH